MTSEPKLTARQQQAIVALLAAPSVTAAAGSAGIAEKTLRRWLALPAFAAAFRAARQEMFRDAAGRLAQIARKAVDTLDRNLDAERPADAIRAALGILDHGRQAIELDDLIARIEALEKSHEQADRQGGAPRTGHPGRNGC